MRGSRQTPKKERPQWRQCVQIQDVATCGDNALSELKNFTETMTCSHQHAGRDRDTKRQT